MHASSGHVTFQFGLVIYGGLPPRLVFDVYTYADVGGVNAGIDGAGEVNWGTNTDEGFLLAGSDCFGASPEVGVPKVVILLTDGKSSDTLATVAEADKLRVELGATVVAVGVDKADDAELLAIADGSAEHTYKAASFDDLDDGLVAQVMKSACVDGGAPG